MAQGSSITSAFCSAEVVAAVSDMSAPLPRFLQAYTQPPASSGNRKRSYPHQIGLQDLCTPLSAQAHSRAGNRERDARMRKSHKRMPRGMS
eukprot:753661-Hanusia_phi.AAC.2